MLRHSFEWGVLSILMVGRRLKRCSRLAFDCLRVGGNPPTTGKTSDVYFSAEQLMSEKGQLFTFESVCRQTGSNSKKGPTPSAARHQHTQCHARDLTDKQWKILDQLIPEPIKRRDGRPRFLEEPPISDERHPMGLADRCALGRPSRPIPVVSGLSQAFSTMGPLRTDDEDHGCSR